MCKLEINQWNFELFPLKSQNGILSNSIISYTIDSYANIKM